jgi:cytochrome c oxidase subunit 2
MKRLELIGLIIVLLVVIGTPVASFAGQFFFKQALDCPTIVMRTYENGNPYPDTVTLKRGQKACLRLTSDDVTHGFTLSDLGVDAGAIHPGKWTTVEFVPQESGTFNYVCSIRCSPMHSRVRGKIVVED